MAALADWLMLFSMQTAVLIVVAAIGEAGIAMPAAVRLTYWRAVLCGSLLLAPPSAMGVSLSALTIDARSMVFVVTSLETVGPTWRLSDVILLVWLGGVVASGTRLAVGLLALRRLRTAPDVRPVATALDGPDAPDPQRVGIWWHPGVTHPVSFGIRRPLILLPLHARTLRREALEAVIHHDGTPRRAARLGVAARRGTRAGRSLVPPGHLVDHRPPAAEPRGSNRCRRRPAPRTSHLHGDPDAACRDVTRDRFRPRGSGAVISSDGCGRLRRAHPPGLPAGATTSRRAYCWWRAWSVHPVSPDSNGCSLRKRRA